VSAEAVSVSQTERDWWLRTLLVLGSPRPVFAALRDDSDDAAAARQEPLAAIVFLAGIGGVFMTTIAGRLMDDPEYDALLIGVWAIVAGAIHGIAVYFVVGALVLLGGSFAGSVGSYRRARHVLGFACVPLVASLAVLPVRLAVYGEDAFRTGGADSGAGADVFELVEVGFVFWAVALLAVGIRTVHGWPWPRALAATAVPALAPALALARAYGLV
jgi:Yip1 domain